MAFQTANRSYTWQGDGVFELRIMEAEMAKKCKKQPPPRLVSFVKGTTQVESVDLKLRSELKLCKL